MFTLAALQMKPVSGDSAANLARLEAAAVDAAGRGASLLMAPELCLTGYGIGDSLRDLAEPVSGPMVGRLQRLSRDTGVALVAGFPERAPEGIFNSVVYVDGGLDPVVYRKSHLYGDYERQLFEPGLPATTVFRHRGVLCGLLICYDVEFPENVRRLALSGVQAILVPTALPAGWSATFIIDHMIQTRAFENQIFVAYINQCGSDARFSFAGLSRIAAPDGTLLACGPSLGESLLIATLSPGAFDISRAENSYLRDFAASA